jgi:hypothetical protein
MYIFQCVVDICSRDGDSFVAVTEANLTSIFRERKFEFLTPLWAINPWMVVYKSDTSPG